MNKNRRTEVEVKDGDAVKTSYTRFYSGSHKQPREKVETRGRCMQQRKSATFSSPQKRSFLV